MIAPNGIITTFAGTGKGGYSGDGAGTTLDQPDGDLLTADGTSRRVWVIYGLAAPFR